MVHAASRPAGKADEVRDFELVQQGATPRPIDNSSAAYYVEVSLVPNPQFDWAVANSELRLASVVINDEIPA
ncbi:MAG: hypothetical protein AB8G14_00600 [Ilumatobacter sp.]